MERDGCHVPGSRLWGLWMEVDFKIGKGHFYLYLRCRISKHATMPCWGSEEIGSCQADREIVLEAVKQNVPTELVTTVINCVRVTSR